VHALEEEFTLQLDALVRLLGDDLLVVRVVPLDTLEKR